VADVPGLIPGASEGKGLGLEFLRHVERCSVLVHVIDCATAEPGRDPLSDLDTIEAELEAYDELVAGGLSGRPRLIALNKVDVPDARELADMVRVEVGERLNAPVFEISAASRTGLRELGFAMAERVAEWRASLPKIEATRIVLRPSPVREEGFSVEVAGDQSYVVTGERPRRWVNQTDFNNDEAVGYLADRLARLGVEDALAGVGAKAGAEVTIGDVTFDWVPTLAFTESAPHGLRGTDERLEDHSRPKAEDRKASRKARRTAYDTETEGLPENPFSHDGLDDDEDLDDWKEDE
jgi:GTP-binding protein